MDPLTLLTAFVIAVMALTLIGYLTGDRVAIRVRWADRLSPYRPDAAVEPSQSASADIPWTVATRHLRNMGDQRDLSDLAHCRGVFASLDASRQEHVREAVTVIADAGAALARIAPELRADRNDDGSTPADDFAATVDLAMSVIHSAAGQGTSNDVDRLRALRRYARRWADPD